MGETLAPILYDLHDPAVIAAPTRLPIKALTPRVATPPLPRPQRRPARTGVLIRAVGSLLLIVKLQPNPQAHSATIVGANPAAAAGAAAITAAAVGVGAVGAEVIAAPAVG